MTRLKTRKAMPFHASVRSEFLFCFFHFQSKRIPVVLFSVWVSLSVFCARGETDAPKKPITLARICDPKGSDRLRTLSGCCHILLFYKRGPTDLPYFDTGEAAFKALTNEDEAIRQFGRTPFIKTRNGLRYYLSRDPVFHSDVGEAHRDQCLATFGSLGAPLDTPIILSSGKFSLADLLKESIATFTLDQDEMEWTAMALARYLPPQKEWIDRFGERTDFSTLVTHLIGRNSNTESCAGTHLFQALVVIKQADDQHSILDKHVRKLLETHLGETLKSVWRHQRPDGSWGKKWCDAIYNEDVGTMTIFDYQVLITGHLLEIITSLSGQASKPNASMLRAAQWLEQCLHSAEITPNGAWVCPFTHAARMAAALRQSNP